KDEVGRAGLVDVDATANRRHNRLRLNRRSGADGTVEVKIAVIAIVAASQIRVDGKVRAVAHGEVFVVVVRILSALAKHVDGDERVVEDFGVYMLIQRVVSTAKIDVDLEDRSEVFRALIDNIGHDPCEADELAPLRIRKIEVDYVVAAGSVDLGTDFRAPNAVARRVKGERVLAGVSMDVEVEFAV